MTTAIEDASACEALTFDEIEELLEDLTKLKEVMEQAK